MEKDFRKMLDTLYEAEALIEMALRRKENAPAGTVARLVADKCSLLADMARGWQLPDSTGDDADRQERIYAPSGGDGPQPCAADGQPACSGCPAGDDAGDAALAESEMLEIVAMAAADAGDGEEEDAVPRQEPEPVAAVEEMPAPAGPPAPRRSPLLSSFTINDRFRFRRSLFGNDNARFLESLGVIGALDSADEAYSYLADDLQWDMDAPEVKLFLNVIDRYFAS